MFGDKGVRGGLENLNVGYDVASVHELAPALVQVPKVIFAGPDFR